MIFELREVTTKKELKRFCRFPLRLYKKCPQYVPALLMDEFHSIWNSPCLKYCLRKIWVAVDENNTIVGRVVGIINPRANELYQYKRVRFGWIEFIEDFEVAKALIEAVAAWGKEQGMTQIHGPLGYNTWNKQGMVVEGFENTPQFNCIYNYAYYPAFLNRLGFSKEVDWLQYMMPATQPIPAKVERINQLILNRYNLHLLEWKHIRDFKPYMEDFFKMYNQSFSTVHNFIPLTDEEIRSSIASYMSLIRPELACFVMDQNNKVVAFSVCMPSMSEALKKAKGHILPFGWFHILKSHICYKDIDLMLNGAHPDWKGKGLSSIYHYKQNETAIKRKLRMAVTNPQIESNTAVEVWKEYQTELHTRRRCFIKEL